MQLLARKMQQILWIRSMGNFKRHAALLVVSDAGMVSVRNVCGIHGNKRLWRSGA